MKIAFFNPIGANQIESSDRHRSTDQEDLLHCLRTGEGTDQVNLRE